MLVSRQSGGIRNVSVVVFVENLSRRTQISKAGTTPGESRSALDNKKHDLTSPPLKAEISARLRWLETEIDARYEERGGSMEIIADVLEQGLAGPLRAGNALIEVVRCSDFEAGPFIVFGEQRELFRGFLERLGIRMGLRQPDLAASAALLVIERTLECIYTTGSQIETQTARLLFQCIQHA